MREMLTETIIDTMLFNMPSMSFGSPLLKHTSQTPMILCKSSSIPLFDFSSEISAPKLLRYLRNSCAYKSQQIFLLRTPEYITNISKWKIEVINSSIRRIRQSFNSIFFCSANKIFVNSPGLPMLDLWIRLVHAFWLNSNFSLGSTGKFNRFVFVSRANWAKLILWMQTRSWKCGETRILVNWHFSRHTVTHQHIHKLVKLLLFIRMVTGGLNVLIFGISIHFIKLNYSNCSL